jgi:hypothetical protein
MFVEKIKRRLLVGKILMHARKDEATYSRMDDPTSIWDRFKAMDKQEKRIKAISRSPDNKRVLQAHNKTPDDIMDIYKDIVSTLVGLFNSTLILIIPEYLDLYLTKKEEGLTAIELAIFLKDHIEELV